MTLARKKTHEEKNTSAEKKADRKYGGNAGGAHVTGSHELYPVSKTSVAKSLL